MRLFKLHHILFACALALLGCDKPNESATTEELPKPENPKEKIITFVTLNSPNTYYVNGDNDFAGLEYDLAKLFVKDLNQYPEYQGAQLKLIVEKHIDQILPSVYNGKADIAAADITITESRKKRFKFTIPYQDIQQEVIFNREITTKPPKSIKDLINHQITIPAGTSFAERLTQLKQKSPNLYWNEINHLDSEQLILAVANGEIEFSIADSHLIANLQNHHPNIGVAFAIGEPEKIGWAFAKHGDPNLLEKANKFFTRIKNDGTLRNLIDRYHGNSKRLKPLDIKTFLSRMNTLLPKYAHLFKQAQEITGIDWRLLAAISYQESHWNTFNTSPTGVRGLMMLTEDTADRMGVSDRLDPKQSIPAGAKYINLMIESIPSRIPEPDRTYMSLASYNIGYAHVEDARVLAQRLKLNPDSWADVKKTLVMLNNPKYYVTAKYGYCGCGQPVIFVESIRSYYNILSSSQPSYTPNNYNFKVARADQLEIID
jgi:membrane-bound lytic murein transglycosylase F